MTNKIRGGAFRLTGLILGIGQPDGHCIFDHRPAPGAPVQDL